MRQRTGCTLKGIYRHFEANLKQVLTFFGSVGRHFAFERNKFFASRLRETFLCLEIGM